LESSFIPAPLIEVLKKKEITGHDIGTSWRVFHKLPAVELHAVKIWLVVSVQLLERRKAARYET
jgi:hypothetical protein